MKKIIIFIALLIFIPFFVVIIYNKNYKEIKLEYINNIYIRVKRQKNDIIQTIPLEEYIVGVLAGEMPIDFEMEAFKAQAVASRSYALARIEYNKSNDYDVVDSIMNQVYLDNEYLKSAWGNNYIKNINKLRQAVNETIDEYLVYNDKIVDAMFFSTSNGYTEDSGVVFSSDVPYLKSVESSFDEEVAKAFYSSKSISLQEFYERLGLEYKKELEVLILERSSSNRIVRIKINGKEFKGRDVYQKLGLRSCDFEFVLVGSNVEIKTKGYGHGVGMSQYGAHGMAKNGYGYEDILKHYYVGTTLKKIG